MLAAIIAVAAVILDQITKYFVVRGIELYETKPFIPGVMSLYHTRNTGAAFSMLSSAPWLVSALSVALIIAVMAVLITDRKMDKWTRLGLWLVVAGGLGNVYDRLAYGFVVDMIEVLFMDFAIFNVADICVCCGAFLAAAAMIFSDMKQNTSALLSRFLRRLCPKI